jgi:hypothetical protein
MGIILKYLKLIEMKNYIYLSAIIVMVFFVSCDDLKDSIEVGVRTNIEADFPVISQNITAIEQKSGSAQNDVYGFVGGGAFSLSDIPELQKYMDNLRSITAEDGSIIRFNGAAEGNKILTLKLKYGIMVNQGEEPPMNTVFNYSGELAASGGVIEYLSDLWAPILIGALDANKDKVFALMIEGTANYDVNSTVKIKVPVKVNASPLL